MKYTLIALTMVSSVTFAQAPGKQAGKAPPPPSFESTKPTMLKRQTEQVDKLGKQIWCLKTKPIPADRVASCNTTLTELATDLTNQEAMSRGFLDCLKKSTTQEKFMMCQRDVAMKIMAQAPGAPAKKK